MLSARTMLPVIATLAAAGAASAAIQVGTTFTTTNAGRVYAQFSSSTSPWGTGQLYFVSYTPSGAATVAVTSNTYYSLGKYLFANTGVASGYSVLLGAFEANTVINFAYRVTPPGNGGILTTATVIRTDTAADATYFGLEAGDALSGALPQMAFEDRKGASSDLDRNDMVFNLITVPGAVPAPGSATLAFAGVLALATRGRRANRPRA